MEAFEGRRLVRAVLLFSLAVSMAANVGHTLLAESVIPAWLRMIGAVIWPLFVFFGVEITVRVAWQLIAGHRALTALARLAVLVPAVPAAITSYEHMHAVLLAMGERPFIAMIGPGAVDVMMIGCTITLVITRAARQAAGEPEHDEQKERSVEQPEQVSAPPMTVPREMLAPVAPDLGAVVTEQRARAPRSAPEQLENAVEQLLAGATVSAAAEGNGVGRSTVQRYQKVKVALKLDPAAEIDCKAEKVNPELVERIRAALQERSRELIGAEQ